MQFFAIIVLHGLINYYRVCPCDFSSGLYSCLYTLSLAPSIPCSIFYQIYDSLLPAWVAIAASGSFMHIALEIAVVDFVTLENHVRLSRIFEGLLWKGKGIQILLHDGCIFLFVCLSFEARSLVFVYTLLLFFCVHITFMFWSLFLFFTLFFFSASQDYYFYLSFWIYVTFRKNKLT